MNKLNEYRDRGFLYNLGDNFIGFDDGVQAPLERMGAGINRLATALARDPAGVIGGAARNALNTLDATMFEGAGRDDPEYLMNVLGMAAAPMAPGAANLARNVPNQVNAIRAYHGSPHDFDRFSTDEIGSGSGGQVHGEGLYFSDKSDNASEYVTGIPSGRVEELSGLGVPDDVVDTVRWYSNRGYSPDDAMKDISANNPEYAKIISEKLETNGGLYEVALDVDASNLLDADLPINKQPKEVRAALRSAGLDDSSSALARTMVSGNEGLLGRAGIKGVQYHAGDSMEYVAFNGRDATILSKNGQNTPQGEAQNVLDLLKSGRGADVTDDMLSAADDMYLFNNYDLPMDEAARMARAKDMGFDTDTPLYHGTAADFPAFNGEVWGSQGKSLPDEYSFMRRDMTGGDQSIYPLVMRAGESFEADRLPKTITVGDFLNEALEQSPKLADGNIDIGEVSKKIGLIRAGARAEESGPHYGRHDFWNNPSSLFGQKGAESIEGAMDDLGFDSYRMIEGGEQTIGVRKPTDARSKFARFDPRLAHLRNLSAGVAGGGVAINAIAQQPETDAIAELRAFLEGL